MTAPAPETHVVRIVDVPTGAGRQTLRCSIMDGPGGRVVTLSPGFGGAGTGDPFLRPEWAGVPVQIPADVLGALRDALAALDGTE